MKNIPSGIVDLIERLGANGDWSIGEVVVTSDCTMRHHLDKSHDAATLSVMTWPEDARGIAQYDSNGKYRPLKTAPNLRRGWFLKLESAKDVRAALDFIYPAALGMYLSALRGQITPVPFRETLGRQTGMYRITQLTRDDQADELILSACNSENGCLRSLVWDLAPGRPQPLTTPLDVTWPTDTIPLLCIEACNLLVAACRPLGKSNLPPPSPPAAS
jgi:sirohydrochlorin cobaltochelatase